MNIFELEKKYDEVVGDIKDRVDREEKVFKLYDSSFDVIELPSDELLAIIRSFDDKMVREEGGVKYLDKSLREMTLTVAFVTQCTDLQMKRDVANGEGKTNSDMVSAYDAIEKMQIPDYLNRREFGVWHRFTHFMYLEEEVFFDKHRVVNTTVNMSGGKG